MAWYGRLVKRLFGGEINNQVRRALLTLENDNTLTLGAARLDSSARDRYPHDREEVLEQSLEAWRINPLARRIVSLTTQYVVGGGLGISISHKRTAAFVAQFWQHHLNRMDTRIYEFCDELTRTGNLFIAVSTDANGMSYLRAYPAVSIAAIEARPNDIEQALCFQLKANAGNLDPPPIPAHDALEDGRNAQGGFDTVMLHYAVNRPVGAQWGEPDLAPLLRWLARYANWLEDRARLNRFRTAFLYIVKGVFNSEAERIARLTSSWMG